MRFAEPLAFFALIFVPLMILAGWWIEQRNRRRLERAGDPDLLSAMIGLGSDRGRSIRILQIALLSAAMALVALALARPQFGARTELRKARGMDVAVAIDLSRSMLARDVAPSRLGRAQLELEALIRELGGDRVGLIGFTSVALPLCPLTIDHAALLLQLKDASPDDLPRGGTAIADAIKAGKQMLDQSRYPESGKAIIVVTDGEENEGDPKGAAEEALKAGIEVHVVGVGSQAGEPIPVEGGYLKDKSGQTVISRLDESMLEAIASAGGGVAALPGQSGGIDLGPVRARLSQLKKAELEQREVRVYEERYRWALVPAFVLLLAATAIRPARRKRPNVKPLHAMILLAPLLLGAGPLEREHPDVKEGNQKLLEGDASGAVQAYDRAMNDLRHDPRLAFNKGLADLAAGETDRAIESFKSALAGSDDPALRAQAAYALGNAYRGLQRFDEAIQSYRQSLVEDPKQTAARRNLELASAMKRIMDLQPKPPNQDGEKSPEQQDGGVNDSGQQDASGGDSGQNDASGPDGSSGDGGSSGGQDGGSQGQDGGAQNAGQDGGASQDSGAGASQPQPEKQEPLDQQKAEEVLDALESQEKALKNRKLLQTIPKGQVEKDW